MGNQFACLRRRRRRMRVEQLEPRHLLALVIDNLPASELTQSSVQIGVVVQEVDAFLPVISLFWGTADGQTAFDGWEHRELMGSRDVGQHPVTITGLSLDTQYFYRTHAFSLGGEVWASETFSFTTLAPGRATIEALPAAFAGNTNGMVEGNVANTGGEIPTVQLFYGDEDGGQSAGQWDASVDLGEQSAHFTQQLLGLMPATSYFYRFAASNSGGTSWTQPQSFTTAQARPLLISEISATAPAIIDDDNPPFGTRVRSGSDISFDGQSLIYDWIEIENNTLSAVDLSGYTLTDNADNRSKWMFPAGTMVPALDSIVVFASGLDLTEKELDENGALHTNFRLDADGEYLGLADDQGAIVSEFTDQFPAQTANVSYGVFAGQRQYMPVPSPGDPNQPGQQGLATPPRFSVLSHTFTEAFTVEMTTNEANAAIRYTTDGSVPDESSTLYTEPLSIETSIEVRARSFVDGYVPSEVSGESYIRIADDATDFTSDLPIIVIDNFDKRRPGPTRHVDFAMSIFDVDEETGQSSLLQEPQVFSRAAIKVRGQSSSGDPKTPYRVETRDQNDEDLAIAPLGLPADADWVLQGPWSDRTLVHNALAYELGAEVGLLAPRTRYVELFRNLNGGDLEADDYLGLYVLTESIKRSNDRVDIPDLDPGEVKPDQISGGYILRFEQNVSEREDRLRGWRHLELFDGHKYSPEQKEWITDYVEQADTAIERAENSRQYEEFIEVDSFVNSLVMHELGRDQDAYVRSYYLYKDRGGKLVAGPMWDFNLIFNRGCCFDNRNPRGWQFDQDRPGQPTGWNKGDHNWNGKLMDSWDFSQRFIDRWSYLRQDGNLLSLDSLMARIDRHVAEIDDAAERNFERWPRLLTDSSGFPGPRFPTFGEHIEDMKSWIGQRLDWIDDQFRAPPTIQQRNNQFELSAAEGLIYYTLDGTDPFDSSTGEPSASAVAYAGQPVTVATGARVLARVHDPNVDPRRTELTKTQWSAPVSLVVSDAAPASSTNVRITELNYNPHDPLAQFDEMDVNNAEYEFVELQNVSDQIIDLTGVRFVRSGIGNDDQGIAFDFAPQLLEPNQHLVVVANRAAFQSRYGSDITIALGNDGSAGEDGQFGGQLSNAGELIALLDQAGTEIVTFTYGDGDQWPTRADGRGSSLEIIAAVSDPTDPTNWQPSRTVGGSPGADSATPVRDVVINELLANSDFPMVDQIELFNTTNQAIDLNRWYVSDSGRNLLKHQITGQETVIPPGGYLVLDENQLGFGLKGQDDDDAWLVQADDQGRPVRFADQVEFGPSSADVSLGRWPNGQGPLVPMRTTTFGSENSGPRAPSNGDLNADGRVDEADIQIVCSAINTMEPHPAADLNGDGQLNQDDLTELIEGILKTSPGDANLDRVFDSSDLVAVFRAGEYEDGIDDNSTWTEGDWTCDGEFDTSDLVAAFRAGGYVQGATKSSVLIPDRSMFPDGEESTERRILKRVHSSMDQFNDAESRRRALLELNADDVDSLFAS